MKILLSLFVMVVKKDKKSETQKTRIRMTRSNRVVISLNDREMAFMNRFYNKYKITNKTKWMRETLIVAILKKLEADAPTLFSEEEMR